MALGLFVGGGERCSRLGEGKKGGREPTVSVLKKTLAASLLWDERGGLVRAVYNSGWTKW